MKFKTVICHQLSFLKHLNIFSSPTVIGQSVIHMQQRKLSLSDKMHAKNQYKNNPSKETVSILYLLLQAENESSYSNWILRKEKNATNS